MGWFVNFDLKTVQENDFMRVHIRLNMLKSLFCEHMLMKKSVMVGSYTVTYYKKGVGKQNFE